MDPVRTAFDIGPLAGPRTGVGHAVAAMHHELASRDDVELVDYLISFRAKVAAGTVRLPMPAALAHRCWARVDVPRADRWLRADVVHGTNYVVPPTHLPSVVSVYDCWFLRHPTAASPAVRRAGEVLRRAIARGAVVHASSQSTADEVRDLFPRSTVEVIHLGPLPVAESPAAPVIADLGRRRMVLAIGTLERRKNLPRLIRAFASIAAVHADTVLVLAGGDGDDRRSIDAAIDAAGSTVAGRVLLTGRVDDQSRAWLLRNAAVLAYPSLDEGFGFPLLDAMQVGVPMVASNAGSIPEVAGGAALMCAPDDVDGLAANLVVALTDDAVRRDLLEAGRAQLDEFSWVRCADRLAHLYRRLAEGNER